MFKISFTHSLLYLFILHFSVTSINGCPYHFSTISFITGPSSSFTISPNSSALINEMQHNFPSFSQLTTASFSPARMSALSLSSLGSTICPRSSMLINDSTLQQLILLSADTQGDLFFFTILITSSYAHVVYAD